MIRQGNQNSKVNVYTYVTEGTFDSYLYQLVEQKQKFISQIMTSRTSMRSMEDIDEKALSYGEIKALATGDTRILEKTNLDADVSKLTLLKQSFLNQKYELQDKLIKFYPSAIEMQNAKIAAMEEDVIKLRDNTLTSDNKENVFSPMTINCVEYTDKEKAGKMLLAVLQDLKGMEVRDIGEYRGFNMSVSFDSVSRNIRVTLKNRYSYSTDLGLDAYGNITRINNLLDNIKAKIPDERNKLDTLNQQMETAKVEVQKEFPQEQELKEKMDKLNQLNAELNIKIDENEIIDDFDDEKENDKSKEKSDKNRNGVANSLAL